MSAAGRRSQRAHVRAWFARADGDLRTARHTLRIRGRCPFETVCFHAQQCVEKCLKALLVRLQIDFPRTHDIAELVRLLPEDTAVPLSPAEQERLSRYAIVGRYPAEDPSEEPDRREAVAAIAAAERVRKAIRRRAGRA